MKAYKFVPLKYANNFASGEIRISPAHTMRYFDGFEDGRSDPSEFIIEGSIPGGRVIVNSTQNPALNKYMTVVGKGGVMEELEVEIFGDSFQIVDNALIFSASLDIKPELVTLMGDKFDAHAIFEISDFNTFAALVSTEIFHQMHLALLARSATVMTF